MLGRTISRHATGRLAKRVPALKFLAVGEIALLTRRHYQRLDLAERRRLRVLLMRGRSLTDDERQELGVLARKLDGRAFVGNTLDALSPVPLPRLLREGRRKRRR